MREFKAATKQELTKVVCDSCGLQASADGDYEFHEFISISHRCGYSSIHGDGKQIDTDLCQQCFSDMCGDTLRINEDINNLCESNKSRNTSTLEYSNIFDVICQSKSKANQLKKSSDLVLSAWEILSKNKVSDDNELTVALSRVEQLWDAQYEAAEGNELHQLADLICAYEKKDWNSFFDEAPLTDDDFMPGRLKFKSKLTFNEDKTVKGMLSDIPINAEFEDDLSRDSALAEASLDEVQQYLLESITKVMHKHPELRLGQLLINTMNLREPFTELSHIEDNVLADIINQLLGTTKS